MARRKFWGWGNEDQGPTAEQQERLAASLAARLGVKELKITPPPRIEELKAQIAGSSVRLTFTASDSFSIIRDTAYSLDAGDWVTAQPVDGLNDSPNERYDLSLPRPGPGEHSIVVRSVDAAGNTGAGKVIVDIP